MLTNRNISSNIQYGQSEIPNGPEDTLVSMLPMAHMYGMAFEFYTNWQAEHRFSSWGKFRHPKFCLMPWLL